MADSVDFGGLDYAFLRYTGVNSADQRKNQSFYLPFFADCRRVVDLGCGDGDFVQLLVERGVDALGVDNDPVAVEHMRGRGLAVIDRDALTYLENVQPASVDGVFSSHLVEHLPYRTVYELIAYAHRALKPGGRIVLTTPNARALVSHLEMYWLHFGHVSFYHPRLLCFFLHHAGFESETWGENPAPAYPLFGAIHARLAERKPSDLGSAGRGQEEWIRWQASVPQGQLSRWRNYLRVRWARLLGLDDIVNQLDDIVNQLNTRLSAQQADWVELIERLDRPFECYATAVKP